MLSALTAGFSLGLSLIVAIGAQNAFVLRQGLNREYVFVVCLLCALSDAALILFGVFGFDWAVAQIAWIERVARYGGAVFLFGYGARSMYKALRATEHLHAAQQSAASCGTVALTCLALTWLNPHVYLDTVILLGSVSTQYAAKWHFAMGAVLASFTFFFALGYGARIAVPLFAKARSWKILDAIIAIIMWSLGVALLFG